MGCGTVGKRNDVVMDPEARSGGSSQKAKPEAGAQRAALRVPIETDATPVKGLVVCALNLWIF